MYTASHLTYYLLCHRKLWLHHQQIRMEDNSADVSMGKLIERRSYQRRAGRYRQVDLGHVKLDHFDPRERVVREIKKSPKLEASHVAQLKYYLYCLEQRGVCDVTGLLEYPRYRRTVHVELTEADRRQVIPGYLAEIERITTLEVCPAVVRKSYCERCAFHDWCYC